MRRILLLLLCFVSSIFAWAEDIFFENPFITFVQSETKNAVLSPVVGYDILVTVGDDSVVALQREPSTHVTAAQAMEVGYAFMHTGSGSKSGGTQSSAVRKQSMQLIYTGKATDSLTRATVDCYYVFALQPKGFVIVAADERVNPILGYSYDNNFVVENMPEHVRGWLGDYEKQIQWVSKSDQKAESDIKTKWSRLKSGQSFPNTRDVHTVGPLLSTKWNQAPYYNALCPEDPSGPGGHALTGCVATAMAQIINYHQYPQHGRGIHSYNSNYGTLTVNYDSAYYDYTNMPDTLSENCTSAEKNAVATLMYHCGVAANMSYTADESGAFDFDARASLVNFFCFSPNLSYAVKANFSDEQWNNLLQENIGANLPVMYSGSGPSGGGHTFVCDGYNSDNYYHFNFGWSGNNDGWYRTSAINPGVDEFNSDQSALVGIIPDINSNVILGQLNGTSSFMVDEQALEFYHLLGLNAYTGLNYYNNCNNTVTFVSADTSKQVVLDVISFENQYVTVYDGSQGNQLASLYSGSADNLNPAVSTAHALTLVYQGDVNYTGFQLLVSQDNGCRMVSNATWSVDTTTIHLSWHENGNSIQWQVEYGLKGFSHGNGTMVTANDTTIDIGGLTSFREYDMYIRSVCGANQTGPWCPVVTVMPEAKYWTDVVTSQPEGYVEDSLGNVTISSAEGLAWFAKLSLEKAYDSDPRFFTGRKVMLNSDINLSRYKWKSIYYFCGEFDGQGYKIDSMYSIEHNHSYYGASLFDHVDLGVLKNIYLTNCYSKAFAKAGGIACSTGQETIMNCFVSGRMEIQSNVAGNVAPITCYASTGSLIINCVSNCQIWGGASYTGGVIGGADDGSSTIRNCYSASTFQRARSWTGYILGHGAGITVENCYGYMARHGYSAIANAPYSTLRDNTWFDETDSGFYLVQPVFFETDSQNHSSLVEVLNEGVKKYNIEGLRIWVEDTAGINEGMPMFGPEYVVTCPNIQNLAARNVANENGEFGVELSWTEMGNAYAWEVEYHEVDSANTVRMMTISRPDTIWGLAESTTYVFRVRPICGMSNYGGWSDELNHVFDRLYWTEVVTSQPEGYNMDAEGNVTISSAEGLAWLASVVNGLNGQTANDFYEKTVILTQDVNIGLYKWAAINEFWGAFDGQGHLISDLYVNELTNYQGLFGLVHGGKYLNVNLNNAYVKGGGAVGILIGQAKFTEGPAVNLELFNKVIHLATIINCHVSGTVFGENQVGGLAGYVDGEEINMCSSSGIVHANQSGAGGLFGYAGLYCYDGGNGYKLSGKSVRNCYSRCVVTAENFTAGGLGGISPMENCYAVGTVTSHRYAGGLSSNGGEMRNCYAAAEVPGNATICWGLCEYSKGSLFGPGANAIVSNCYGLAGLHPLIGTSIDGDPLSVTDTASFTVVNDSIVLLNSVAVGQTYYDNLLDALNAWVDTYDTAGVFLHWVADTSGINGGFPMFEDIKYNSVVLAVANSTPYGAVSGAGSYTNYEPVNITAIPDYGYHFVQWNDGNTDNPRVLKLTQDTAFTAFFEKDMFSVVGTEGEGVNYGFDFENPSRDYLWILQNGDHVNQWCISMHDESNRALFISNSNGIYNNYFVGDQSDNAAYTTILLTAGQYDYNYIWHTGMFCDEIIVALIPVTEQLPSSGWMLPDGAILLGSHPSEIEEWTSQSGQVDIPSTSEYFVWVFWKNYRCGGGEFQAPAIDNFQFEKNPGEEDSHGYVLGSDTVPYLDTVLLSAIPHEGYCFSRWHDGNTDNPRAVVATADKYYVAQFAKRLDTTNIIVQLPENGYEYSGDIYTHTGVYSFNYTAENGCDSVVNLILCDESLQICSDHLPYSYGDTTFEEGTVSGLYPIISQGQDLWIYLKVNPTYLIYDTINTCDNRSEYVGNVCFYDSLPGDYIVPMQSSCGCDSVVNLHYTVSPSYVFDLYDTIPRGMEYTANGFNLSSSLTQNVRQRDWNKYFTTVQGCDSIYALHLTLTGTPIYYVTQNGTGDGSSWANAMGNLQAAMDSAALVQGDVWVAEGTYYGDGVSENAFVLPAGIHVYGGFAGNEPEDYNLSWRDFNAHPTILDGQHVQRTVYREVDWGVVSIMDGFIVQNGYGYAANVFGGYFPISTFQVVNCIIQGGVSNGESGGLERVTVRNSVIRNNYASSWGSAICSCDASNCVLVGNSASDSEYGSTTSFSTLTNCVIWNNIGYPEYDCVINYSAVEGQEVLGEGNMILAHNNDGTSLDSNYVRFVDPENGDFRLAYGSACINAGTPDISGLSLPSVDLQGLPRVLDGRIDMGAYEYYPVPVVEMFDNICAGSSVMFYGFEYTDAGNYQVHTNPDPMQDTLNILHLTVNYGTHNVLDTTVCESFTWTDGTGETYTTSDTYNYAYTNAFGCASVDTLHLTVNYGTHNVLDTTVCESFTWTDGTGETYTQSGTYVHLYSNSDGCPSADTLHLTIHYGTHNVLDTTVCESFTWTAGTGQTYTQSGTYIHHYNNGEDCPSADTLHLAIHYGTHNVISVSECEAYTWTAGTGQTYTQSGTYIHHYNNGDGCPSADTLHLTIHYGTHNVLDNTVCESFTWTDGTGETYTTSDTYTYAYTNASGCASVDTLHLTIYPTYNVQDTQTVCESALPYPWNGVTFTSPGTQEVTLKTIHYCDSVVSMTLIVDERIEQNEDLTICENELPYPWRDTIFKVGTETGAYYFHRNSSKGCDSVVTLHLTICEPFYEEQTAVTCANEPYAWDGHSVNIPTTVGNHIIWDSLKTTSCLCDSVYRLVLTVLPSPENLKITGLTSFCEGGYTTLYASGADNYEWNNGSHENNLEVTGRGTYSVRGTNDNGCTSIDSVRVEVYPNPEVYIKIENKRANDRWVKCINEGETWGVYLSAYGQQGNTYHWFSESGDDNTNNYYFINQASTYIVVATSAVGCTNSASLEVIASIIPTISITGLDFICDGDSTTLYAFGGETYLWTTSGDEEDSIIVNNGGTYQVTGFNADRCSNTASFRVTVWNPVTHEFSETACDSYTWNGETYTESGDYVQNFQTIHGCDSVVTLHLTISNHYITPVDADLCEGGTYSFGDRMLSQSGIYYDTLLASNYCDSIIELNLTVHQLDTTYLSANICLGETYDKYGFNVTPVEFGDTVCYQVVESGFGCDSTVILTLTVNPSYNHYFDTTVCGKFVWNDSTYIVSDTVSYTYRLATRCDSTVTYNLTVNPTYVVTVDTTVCDMFVWNDITYTVSDTISYTYSLATGCDSTVTVNLTVNHSKDTILTPVICQGASYTENGFNQHPESAGIVYDTLNIQCSGTGCDSIVYLELTVNQIYETSESRTICESELPYTWNGVVFTQADTQTVTLQSSADCDSVVTMTLTVNPIYSESESRTVCESELPYTWNGVVFNQADTQTVTLQSSAGCDSVVTMTLKTYPVYEVIDTITICKKQLPYRWNGVEFTQAGTQTVTLYTVNGCDSVVTMILRVNPIVQINNISNQVVCNGASTTPVTFTTNSTGPGNVTYRWSNDKTSIGLAAFGLDSIASFTGTNSGTQPVMARITVIPTYTYGGVACQGISGSFTITVNPTARVNNIGNQVVCNGEWTTPVTFTTSNSGGTTIYTWTNDAPSIGISASGRGNIVAFNAKNYGTEPIVAHIGVTPHFVNGGDTCDGSPKTFTITVNPTAQVDSVNDQVVCNGEWTTPITFTTSNSGGTTIYTWTNDVPSIGTSASGKGNIAAFNAKNHGTEPIVAHIEVTPHFVNGGDTCDGSPKTFTITVNPTAQVDSVSSQVVCNGDSTATVVFGTNAMGADTMTYRWTNSNPAIGLSDTTGTGNLPAFQAVNNGTAPVSTTITVTPTYIYREVDCEGTPMIFTITVNPTAHMDSIPDQVVCNGDSTENVVFSTDATGEGAVIYTWTVEDATIGLSNGSGNTLPSFTAVNDGTEPVVAVISVTPTYLYANDSCVGVPTSFTITVNPTVRMDSIANQVVCNGSMTDIVVLGTNASGEGTVNYEWTVDYPEIGLSDGSGDTLPSFTTVNNTTALLVDTVTVTPTYTFDNKACQGTPTNFTITVNPTAQVDSVNSQVVCNGDSTATVVFGTNAVGADTVTYSWTNSNQAIGLSDTAGTGNLPAFQAVNNGTAPDSTIITVTPIYTYLEVDCEGTPMSFTITVNPTVHMDSIPDQVVCNGDSTETVVFSTDATGEGAVIYTWMVEDATIGLSNGSGNTLPSFTAVNDGTEPVVAVISVTPTYLYANDSCVGVPTSFTITVNPTVRMDSMANQVVCNGSMTDIVVLGTNASGEGTVNYEWTVDYPEIGLSDGSGDTLPSFTTVNNTTVLLVDTVTVTPTYTFDNKACQGTPTNFTITVIPTAQVDSVSSQVVCNGDSTVTVVFGTNAMGADTVTYSWTNSNQAIGLFAATGTGNLPAFLAVNNSTAPVNTTITVTPTYIYREVDCEGTPMSFTITVNPTAQVNDIGNQVVCNGASMTLIAFTTNNTGGTTTYTWTNDTPGIGIDTIGEGNISAFTAVNNGTEPIVAHIRVTPHFANAGMFCDGPVKEFTITINPTVAENSISDQVRCDGALTDAVFFGTNATGEGTVTYAWTNNNPGIGLAETGEPGSTGIAPFTVTNGTDDPISGTITVTPTYTYANVSCVGTAAVFTITVNPNPSVYGITGDSVFCQNQYAVYTYPVENTDHYLYSWYLHDIPVGVNLDRFTYYVAPDSLSYDTNVVIKLEVMDLATGCMSDTSMSLRICSHNSPDTTFIIRKNNSNMLICRGVSSTDGVVHYQWGYTDKETGDEMIYTWDYNYYQYGHDLNTTLYDYWVETYIIYGDVICRNRTYYVVDVPVGIESYNDDFNVLVYQQNGQCHLRIVNSGMHHITGGLYDITGKLLQKMDYGKAPVVEKQLDLDYAHGVYVLVLYADGKRYTTKIAW